MRKPRSEADWPLAFRVKEAKLPSETDYLHAFMARASSSFRDVRVFRRNTGAIRLQDRFFHSGIAGQCDAYAIGKGGRHFEIEAKSLNGKLNPAQGRWRDWCTTWGIPWMLLRPVKDETPGDTVGRWLEHCRLTWDWS